jgi:hypothetical protein
LKLNAPKPPSEYCLCSQFSFVDCFFGNHSVPSPAPKKNCRN